MYQLKVVNRYVNLGEQLPLLLFENMQEEKIGQVVACLLKYVTNEALICVTSERAAEAVNYGDDACGEGEEA